MCMLGCWQHTCCLPLTRHQDAVNLSLLYSYHLGMLIPELVPLSHSRGQFARYSDRLHYFHVTILTCWNQRCLCQQFFPCKTSYWNSLLPISFHWLMIKSTLSLRLMSCLIFQLSCVFFLFLFFFNTIFFMGVKPRMRKAQLYKTSFFIF